RGFEKEKISGSAIRKNENNILGLKLVVQQKGSIIFNSSEYTSKIIKLEEYINDVNASNIGIDKNIPKLQELSTYARNITNGSTYKHSLFQTDLYIKQKTAVIDKVVAEDVITAIGVLTRFATSPSNDELTSFARKFYEKYEEEEIPILEAL